MENTKEESWQERFDEEFKYLGEDSYDINRTGIKNFISSLLSKASAEEASGCFDHAQMEVEKEKARIREEVNKLHKPTIQAIKGTVLEMKENLEQQCRQLGYEICLEDIKEILK